MRVLATADLHGNHAIYRRLPGLVRESGVDALILAGDLLGAPAGHPTQEDAQRADAAGILAILRPIARPVLYLMGNDDLVPLEAGSEHVVSLHGRRLDLGAFNFVGYQYTLPFMGGVNERPEEVVAADLAALSALMDHRTVLVSHGPAHGVLDPGVLGEPAGSPSLGEVIERRNVRAHVHGHVHAGFGRSGRHFNVASGGKHVRAMVIDLESLTHAVIDESGPAR